MAERIFLHLEGKAIAEVFDLKHVAPNGWTFSCIPPVLDAEQDYHLHPEGGKPLRIMVSSITLDGARSYIQAVEP